MPTLNVASLGGLEGKFQLLEDASAFVVAVIKEWRTGKDKPGLLSSATNLAADLHIDGHVATVVADLVAYLSGGPDAVAGVLSDLAALGMPSYLQATANAALSTLQQAIADQRNSGN